MTTIDKYKVRDSIYPQRDKFVRLAHVIHEHPELAFGEERAPARITTVLADEGYEKCWTKTPMSRSFFSMPLRHILTMTLKPSSVILIVQSNND